LGCANGNSRPNNLIQAGRRDYLCWAHNDDERDVYSRQRSRAAIDLVMLNASQVS
jgi:hypothetical protein